MKLKAVIALALAATAAPTFAAGESFSSKLKWGFDVGTHVYDMAGTESFNPSLELGLHAMLPLANLQGGDITLEAGLSQTVIYGTSKLKTRMDYLGYSLETVQADYRRVFMALGFETQGRWYLKPQIGFEHITAKIRLYDPDASTGFTERDGDSNGFAAIGIGHRFADGKKGVLTFASLGDADDQDYRITYSASF